jgi:type VI secretion system secreted protein VgrG
VDGSLLGAADVELHLESGLKIVLDAGSELTLKAGGSWIKFDNSGITGNGPAITLNSGASPGNATPAEPLLPHKTIPVLPGLAVSVSCLEIAQMLDAPFVGTSAMEN